MQTWFLILYLSTNTYLSQATGGPMVVPEIYHSKEECEKNGKRLVDSVPKADWYHCDLTKK